MLIAIAILITLFIVWSKSSSGKGTIGEWRVRLKIGRTKPGKQYVLNNYMVLVDGKSSQIDHIVIRKNGIFVIETKNYSGRIYGNQYQQEWTQVLNYGKVKNKLYNPIKQNATHIYRIKKVIGENIDIISLVVFVQNNTRYLEAENVIPLWALSKTLRQTTSVTLTPEKMQYIYDKLVESKANLIIDKYEHISVTRQIQADLHAGICPRCGGRLVERKSKFGTFFGCSNYPKCKFIKKY